MQKHCLLSAGSKAASLAKRQNFLSSCVFIVKRADNCACVKLSVIYDRQHLFLHVFTVLFFKKILNFQKTISISEYTRLIAMLNYLVIKYRLILMRIKLNNSMTLNQSNRIPGPISIALGSSYNLHKTLPFHPYLDGIHCSPRLHCTGDDFNLCSAPCAATFIHFYQGGMKQSCACAFHSSHRNTNRGSIAIAQLVCVSAKQ